MVSEIFDTIVLLGNKQVLQQIEAFDCMKIILLTQTIKLSNSCRNASGKIPLLAVCDSSRDFEKKIEKELPLCHATNILTRTELLFNIG